MELEDNEPSDSAEVAGDETSAESTDITEPGAESDAGAESAEIVALKKKIQELEERLDTTDLENAKEGIDPAKLAVALDVLKGVDAARKVEMLRFLKAVESKTPVEARGQVGLKKEEQWKPKPLKSQI